MQWKSETKFSRPLATSGKEDARVGRGTSRHGLACVFPDCSDVVDGFCREAKRDTKTKHCDANSVTALVVVVFERGATLGIGPDVRSKKKSKASLGLSGTRI